MFRKGQVRNENRHGEANAAKKAGAKNVLPIQCKGQPADPELYGDVRKQRYA